MSDCQIPIADLNRLEAEAVSGYNWFKLSAKQLDAIFQDMSEVYARHSAELDAQTRQSYGEGWRDAIEECARVAEDRHWGVHTPLEEIAAAIRALKDK